MFIFHTIDDDYLFYLSQHEDKVFWNKNSKRPYVGVILIVNDLRYFVPLASPKPKHKKMKNEKDFYKILGGQYGVINFNKMIPVPDSCLIHFDISEQNEKYKTLLNNQKRELDKNEKHLCKMAKDLYQLFCTEDNKLKVSDRYVKQRCCDFLKPESLCKCYTD